MTIASVLVQVSTVGWGVLCGAMIYEHLAVVPSWAAAPPASLHMWTGEYRVKAERFWMSIHPLLLLLLGASLVAAWGETARRDWIGVALGVYAVIIATTAVWYVPELMKLTRDPAAPIPPDQWRHRARRWEVLSWVRGALVLANAYPILRALTVSA